MRAFIDLGSHFGAIIKKFMASKLYTSDCKLYAFEPNPRITQEHLSFYPECVNISTSAAWINDGTLDFYINDDPRYQGSSVCKEKTTGFLNKESPVIVKCFDFSEWMNREFREGDDVIIKMNIEGAEYKLIPRMIQDGSINFVSRLYLRRHWHKIGLPESVDNLMLDSLRMVDGLQVFNDYNFQA